MEIFYSTGMSERSGSNIPSRKLINGACSRDPAVILIVQPRRARDRRYHAMVPSGHAQGLLRRHVVSENGPTISTLILGGVASLAYSEQKPGDCGYYINSNGHQVPRPCGNSKIDAPPAKATAICRDGSYSFSEHPYASETCSHHGGIASHLTR